MSDKCIYICSRFHDFLLSSKYFMAIKKDHYLTPVATNNFVLTINPLKYECCAKWQVKLDFSTFSTCLTRKLTTFHISQLEKHYNGVIVILDCVLSGFESYLFQFA